MIDLALKGVKTLISIALWCFLLMFLGLVVRINWELFMLGWRAVG